MMQSCASVAKLRSGGPILCYGVIPALLSLSAPPFRFDPIRSRSEAPRAKSCRQAVIAGKGQCG